MTVRRAIPLMLLTIGILVLLVYQPSGAADDNRVALVVDFGNGQVAKRCVSFSEETITGYEALMRSGLPVETDFQSGGAAVCRIDGQGCPPDDCFCSCRGGGSCIYWSYWHLNDGGWSYSAAGSGIYRVDDGDIDGWVWGLGSVTQASPPPLVSFDDVCAAAPTNTPTTTATPSRTSTPVILPTDAPTNDSVSSGVTPTQTQTPQGVAPTATLALTSSFTEAAGSPRASAAATLSLPATPTILPVVQESATTQPIEPLPQMPLPATGAADDASTAGPLVAEPGPISATVPPPEEVGVGGAPALAVTEPDASQFTTSETGGDLAAASGAVEGVPAPAMAVAVVGADEMLDSPANVATAGTDPAVSPASYAGFVGLLLFLGALALLIYRRRAGGGAGR